MGVPLKASRAGIVEAESREIAAGDIGPALEGIWDRYGYDFRDYDRPSLERRIKAFMNTEGLSSLSGFEERILSARDCMQRFLMTMSAGAASMFRDPEFHSFFRRDIIPVLRTYPFIRIWHAGCSTGQEVYSMAIMLAEEGLYDRCRIYATDLDESVLGQARDGVYSLGAMRKYTRNYRLAGGNGRFSDYYATKYNSAIIDAALRKNIVFGRHNLVSDGSFNEFQVVFCRNVLVLFNARLQARVLGLFHDSLAMFGYLGLGSRERVSLAGFEGRFREMDVKHRLYRKVA